MKEQKKQAEDAVIEAYMRMIPYVDECTDAESKKTRVLLVCCVKHAAIDIYRKNKKCQNQSQIEDLDMVEDSFHPMEAYHQMMEHQEQITVLKETLPSHYWEMLEHRYMLGQSVAEISEICGLDVENVYSRLRRAKKKAREILMEKREKEEAICIKKKYSCI